MATCTHCTRTLPEDAVQCPFCGTKVRNAAEQTQPEQDLLYRFRLHLRREQKCWRVFGLIMTVVTVILLACAAFTFLSGDLIPAIVYAALTLYGATAVLINMIQFNRTEDFIEGIYIDCTPALERVEHNGYLLLGIFFNPAAAVLFGKTKLFTVTNREALFKIMQEQDRRYESTFRNDRFHSVN